MRTLALCLFLALPGVAPGQRPPQAPPVDLRRVARAVEEAMKPPQGPPVKPVYDAAFEQALDLGVPLVVFVGNAPHRPIKGCLTCRINYKGEFPADGIVVGVPCQGGLSRIDLKASAEDSDILRAIRDYRCPVPQAVPFQPAPLFIPQFQRPAAGGHLQLGRRRPGRGGEGVRLLLRRLLRRSRQDLSRRARAEGR
jgi:hypothetical protein